MESLTDTEIFDLLDGMASEELNQRHQELWRTDERYRQYFDELHTLHQSLRGLSIESPSVGFENTLLHRLEISQREYKLLAISKRTLFLFVGLMMGLMLIGLLLLHDGQSAANHLFVPALENTITYVGLEDIQKVLFLINGLLLLLVCEKLIKKYLELHWRQL
ncbi:MAG: hypothetical protein R2822_26005 [Spirosomataceae bacterium]